MKKFSNINESTWGDMVKRAEGEQIRKEDDINLLDREGLYDYLIHHYKGKNHFASISTSISFNTIEVPIIINGGVYRVYFDFNANEVYVHYATLYMVNKLLIKVSKNFSLRSNSNEHPEAYIISPKDGSKVTNQFFIDVIDFFIDNIPDSEGRAIKKIVNESTWGDMVKRAEGEQIRREDDINLLDIDGLWGYINDNYKNLSHRETWVSRHDTGSFIHIPMFRRYNRLHSIYLKFKTDKISEIQIEANRKTCSEFISIVEEKYKIDDNGGFGMVTITSKTGEFTNQDAIDIINIIIENSSYPVIQKK